MIDPNCKVCKGEGWVCESHPDKPWNEGAGHHIVTPAGSDVYCHGAGAPCKCNQNPLGQPLKPKVKQ
jgi:hypothetical protein